MPFDPLDDGPQGGYANTSGTTRREINGELVTQVTSLDLVKRNGKSIYTSANFHLDSRMVNREWKVEIQYGRVKGAPGLSGKTVAVVFVADDATSVRDFKSAVKAALTTARATMYRVT